MPGRSVTVSSWVAAANAGRNAGGGRARRARWAPVRTAAWALLDRHVPEGAAVAVVGAGNGDTLPLRRLAARAGRLDLVDLDPAALRRARRRCGPAARLRTRLRAVDVTAGEADAIVARALGRTAPGPSPALDGQYDVVVADCFYTQLLYPALADSPLTGPAVDRVLLEHGQALTNAVVARLHAAAPAGVVVHLHDVLGWSAAMHQPFAIDAVLALAAAGDAAAALRLVDRGSRPYGCDPRAAVARLGAPVLETALWRWPFGGGVEYLVCATVAGSLSPVA